MDPGSKRRKRNTVERDKERAREKGRGHVPSDRQRDKAVVLLDVTFENI